jgi:leader peptidase (prepilin peptidase) / N-methyltransferase
MISVFTLLALFFFVFGIVIGSFLNVVILRFNTGMGVDGRSQCFSCGKQLVWYELVPVFSYIFLRGRCSQCKSHISIQYPLVEFATGLVFVALFYAAQPFVFLSFASFIVSYLISVVIFCILIVIFVYDLRHKIIPDGFALALAILGVITIIVQNFPLALKMPSLYGLLAGPLLAAPFALLWLVSKGTWMGLGDAKLAIGLGWILGIIGGLTAIILAFWVGAVVSIIILLIQKFHISRSKTHLTMKSEIPFAPFLIIGFSLVYFFHVAIPGISQLSQFPW